MTTNEALKSYLPNLKYETIKVERSDQLIPFDGSSWSDTGLEGFIRVGSEIMAVAEIIDEHTVLVGRYHQETPR